MKHNRQESRALLQNIISTSLQLAHYVCITTIKTVISIESILTNHYTLSMDIQSIICIVDNVTPACQSEGAILHYYKEARVKPTLHYAVGH